MIGALIGVGLPCRAHAQSDSAQLVWISVRHSSSGAPIARAAVYAVNDAARRVPTDSGGLAQLTIDRPNQLVIATRLGFRPETVLVDAKRWAAGLVEISLQVVAQELAPLRVVGESPGANAIMRDFDARRARAGGGASFIGPEMFARSSSSRITDFLRRGTLGVSLVDSLGIMLPVSARGPVLRVYQNQTSNAARRQGMELVHCVLRIVVDGIPKEWGFDLNSIDPREVYGVEVYSGPATIPAQFQSMGRDGYCGLLLVWTRPR